jgi:putative endonuclease
MKAHCYSVYIIASKSRVLYIGMTNDLSRRTYEHKNDLMDGFTTQYRCHRLVYYESFDDVNKAIDREKQLKRWNRTKKVWLIVRRNPTWEDLAAEWVHASHVPARKAGPTEALRLVPPIAIRSGGNCCGGYPPQQAKRLGGGLGRLVFGE